MPLKKLIDMTNKLQANEIMKLLLIDEEFKDKSMEFMLQLENIHAISSLILYKLNDFQDW